MRGGFPGDPGLGRTWKELRWSPAYPCPAGRMYLFYGNKTSVQFQNFSPTVVQPWGPPDSYPLGLAQPCPSRSAFLAAGKQIQIPVWPPYLRA